MSYLITGANGVIGGHVAAQLAAQGHQVHTLTRTPLRRSGLNALHSFLGDLNSREFEASLFAGVEALFLFPAAGSVDAFLTAAKNRGVQRVVVLSSLAAAQEFPRDLRSPSALHHRKVEQAVLDSGLAFTFLRCGTFANNLRQWAPTIKAQGMVFGPYPNSVQAPLHEADIADAAVAALTLVGHSGVIHRLTGPEALSQSDQLAAIGGAIGRRLTYKKTTAEQFRASVGPFMPADIVQMLLDYWADTERVPEVAQDNVESITGKPARRLAAWAADHADEFR